MEVAEEDGGLGAGDDQDDEDEEEEAVHVVDLTAPDAVQHKEKLDEDATKGKHASHDNSRDWLSVDGLVWDLPWDLICPHRLLNRSFPEAKIGSDKGEGDGDSKPERQERDQSEEWDRGRGAVVPEHQVQDEEVSEDDARTKHACQEDVWLPLFSTKTLVDPRRHISGRGSQAHEENESTGHKSASVSGWEETKAGKDQGDACHAEQLSSWTKEHRQ